VTLSSHVQIAEMTHVLAHIFILLFSKGLGAAEEPTEDSACDGSQDACGTGMGEGEGINDVSEQIEDEAQLLGTSDKVIYSCMVALHVLPPAGVCFKTSNVFVVCNNFVSKMGRTTLKKCQVTKTRV